MDANLTREEIERTLELARAEGAPATRVAYATDWRNFRTWCAARGVSPLPAEEAFVCVYIAERARQGRKPATICRGIAAISRYHRMAGFEPPMGESVRATMRGIRRDHTAPKVIKEAVTVEVLASMLKHLAPGMIGYRDHALLAFGFASALRRSELAALQVSDLIETRDGYFVRVAGGDGIMVPRGKGIRAVEALHSWLLAADITTGPVFRAVRKGGAVSPRALADTWVGGIVQRYARRAGLDPAVFAAHSLRRGFIVSAIETGASVDRIVQHSRHKAYASLGGYQSKGGTLGDHAGAAFL